MDSCSLSKVISSVDTASQDLTLTVGSLKKSVDSLQTGVTHEAIAETNGQLGNLISSIESLTHALQDIMVPGNSQLLSVIISAAIAGLTAYIFNHLHWVTARKKEKLYSLTKNLKDLTDKLEDESIKYWLKPYKSFAPEESKSIEIKLKSRITVIRKNIDLISIKVKSSKNTCALNNLRNFVDEIYDLITGDGFESVERTENPSKASKISAKCAEIKPRITDLSFCF
jgi:hypothetical protein